MIQNTIVYGMLKVSFNNYFQARIIVEPFVLEFGYVSHTHTRAVILYFTHDTAPRS